MWYEKTNSKKIEKNFKKSVDKTICAWYYSQALEREGKTEGQKSPEVRARKSA